MEIVVFCKSKIRKRVMEKCAEMYATLLNLDRSRYKLVVITVGSLKKDHEALGCTYMDAPREITVVLDSSLRFESMIQTLAHEMIHVKQFALGQLREVKNRRGKPTRMWRGKPARTHALYSPWEREAYRRENDLVVQLLEQFHHAQKKIT